MKHVSALLLVFPAISLAADPFACVDEQYRSALLGTGYQGSPAFSTELPDAFADLPVPDTLELIGSEINNVSVRAVYRSRERGDLALEKTIASFEKNGWQNVQRLFPMAGVGFQSSMMPKMANLCRDMEPGMLSVSISEGPDNPLVSFSMTSYGEGQTCSAMQAQAQRGNAFSESGWKDMPSLTLPENTASANAGMGGGGGEYHSDVVVTGESSRADLLNYLADQVSAQGWEMDASWNGQLSAGSVWTKTTEKTLIGTLHAYGKASESIRVRFAVATAKAGEFAVGARGIHSVSQ